MSTESPINCFESIIAYDYYDGPLSGIGMSGEGWFCFRAVAWDNEQWKRVFAIFPIDESLAQNIRLALLSVEQEKTPFWLPNASDATIDHAWDAVFSSASTVGNWALVCSHDLLDAATQRLLTQGQSLWVRDLVMKNTCVVVDEPLTESFLATRTRSS